MDLAVMRWIDIVYAVMAPTRTRSVSRQMDMPAAAIAGIPDPGTHGAAANTGFVGSPGANWNLRIFGMMGASENPTVTGCRPRPQAVVAKPSGFAPMSLPAGLALTPARMVPAGRPAPGCTVTNP